MISNLFQKLAASLLLAMPSVAQACPFTMAKTVTQTAYEVIAIGECAGVTLNVNGINISTGGGCPLTTIIRPTVYSEPAPSALPTKVEVLALQESMIVNYTCESTYFLLLFPVGSNCTYVGREVIAGPHLLHTVPCANKGAGDIPL